MSIGFTIPFAASTGSQGLFYTTSTTLEAAKNDLKSLLLTNWGERPMRYDMGCNFRQFLFEQIVPGETEVLVDERIRTQVNKWLPFLGINSISVTFPSDHTIKVVMSFFLSSKPDSVDSISLEVSN